VARPKTIRTPNQKGSQTMLSRIFQVLSALALSALIFRSAHAEEPQLPGDVEPLDPALQEKMERLKTTAEQYRGLKLKTPKLAAGQKDKEALKKKVVQMFQEELPPEKLTPLERSLKQFELIPQDMDLAKYYPELLTSQIGGYYDPKLKYLVLVKSADGVLGKELTKKLGQEVAERMEETILVHEIDHAIQDQHFDLSNYGHDTPMSDAAVAKLALIEGDATLVMYTYMLKTPMERIPTATMGIDMLTADPKKMAEMMPSMPGAQEMLTAPAYIRDNMIFSYIQGLSFCLRVRQAGGQKLLDYAFAKDPPKSSEQILHPEKWITKRDDPIHITLPDFAAQLPGYKKVTTGNWGEFNTRLLLSEKLGEANRKQCLEAAAGWGGDAFVLLEREDKQEVLVWLTAWDTPSDASEFFDLAQRAFKVGWQMTSSHTVGAKEAARVVLVRGEVSQEAYVALREALLSVKLESPVNTPVDFAALGITDEDRPKPLGVAEMLGLLNDPITKKMLLSGSGIDMAEQGAGLDGTMGEMLKNPEVQKMVEQMFAQKDLPKGLLGDDGVYKNETLGLNVKPPQGAGWVVSKEPTKAPMGPTPLLEARLGLGTGTFVLVQQAMPMQVPPEMLSMAVDMGLGMQVKGFKKLQSAQLTTNEKKGYEVEYTGSLNGLEVHALQRTYVSGTDMIMVMGSTAAEEWEKHGKAVQDAMASFGFTAPPAKPQEKNLPPQKPAP